MTIAPTSGNQFVRPSVTTSAPCPVGTDYFYVKLYGGSGASALADIGGLMKDPGTIGMSTSAPFTVETGLTFDDTRANAGIASLAGDYVMLLSCETELGDQLKTFTAPVTFNAAGTAFTTPVVTVGSTTSLGASPASPQVQGTSVTFTATVTASTGGSTPSGSVEFFDGATSLGSVATAAGSAALSASALGAGSHSVTATFTGAGYTSSTSSAVSYQITAAPAKSSTTTMSVDPSGSAAAGSSLSITVSVAIAGGDPAAGSVEFYDGVTKIATKPVAGGSAGHVASLAGVGIHTLKAVFVPTDPAAQVGSQDSEDIDITGVPTQALETITVSLAETGALTISVADDTVVLPNFTLDAAGDNLSSAGPVNPVTVTDTRLYEQGWSVSGVVTDFSSGAGSISSTGLGWTPNIVSKPTAASVITAGSVVAPFTDSGLHSSKVLASAASGEGRGSTVLGADLLLKAPTTTVPGTYSALLTLTVV